MIRASSLIKRACEEEEMVLSELATMNERLIEEHSLVLRNIQQWKTHTGAKIISVDAVFGLCRKRSSGASARLPLFSDLFFESQDIVDQFVMTYDAASHVADKVLKLYT